MARIRTGPLVSNLAGSVGGVTFQRGPTGLVMRTRGGRIGGRHGVSAGRQKEFSEVLAYWRGMSGEEKLAWDRWALANPFVDRLGVLCRGTGRRAFISVGMVIRCSGGALVSNTPRVASTVQLSGVSLTAVLSGAGVQIGFVPASVGLAEVMIAWGCVYRGRGSGVSGFGWRGPWDFGMDKVSPLDATGKFVAAFGTLSAGMVLGVRLTVGNVVVLQMSAPLSASCVVEA